VQQGLGRVVAGLAPEFLLQPILVMALAVVLAATTPVMRNAGFAMALQASGAMIALLVGTQLLLRRMPEPMRHTAPQYRAGVWWRAGIAFMWLVMMTSVLTNADTLLVGRIAGDAEAGAYRVASQLAMLVGLPLTAISTAMAPVIASLHASGQRDELCARTRAAARVIAAGALLLAVAIAVAGPRILAAFGPEFTQGYGPTLVLTAAYLVHSAMATSGYLLIMSAHERLVMLIFTAGAAAAIAGGVALIPSMGMMGAAVSSAVSLSLVSVSCAVLAWRRLGINGTVFA
jgi:O-antigen/teichoic acid export membrane protein